MTSAIAHAHANFMAALAVPVPTIRLDPWPEDFNVRATHAALILSSAQAYLLALVRDTAEHSRGYIDADELCESITAALTDLAGDIQGAFEGEANAIWNDRYDDIAARGPMYRARG